jgi:hypothetical protein
MSRELIGVGSAVRKHSKRVKQYGEQLYGRSRITNGRDILPTIDHRSSWARRYRDLYDNFLTDLGQPEDALSEAQRALCKHAAAMCVEMEFLTVKFAENGGADVYDLNVFQRVYNTARRGFESLNTHRGRLQRDVTPPSLDQYLAAQSDDDEKMEAAE